MAARLPATCRPSGPSAPCYYAALKSVRGPGTSGAGRTRPAGRPVERVYYDTPKFELLKRGAAVYSEKRGRRVSFYYAGEGSKVPAEPGAGFFEEFFPYLKLTCSAEPMRAGVSGAVPSSGSILRGVVLENPATGMRSRAAGFAEIITAVEPPSAIGDLRSLFGELYCEKFARLEVPFCPDEAKAGFSISAGDDLSDALCKAVSRELYRVRGYRSFVRLSVHPEYLHEMRVAMRRIRSYLSSFPEALGRKRSGTISITASSYGIDLGRVRDYDVFASRLRELLEEAGAGAEAEFFSKVFSKARKDDLDVAARVISSKKFPAFVERLQNFARPRAAKSEEGKRPFLLSSLEKLGELEALIRKRMKRFRRSGAPEDLHRVRIAFKRFRYVFELAAPFLDGRSGRFKRKLEEIQDALGFCQDLRVAGRLVEEAAELTEDKGKIMVLGSLRQVIRERLGKEIGKFVKLEREFDKLPLPEEAGGG